MQVTSQHDIADHDRMMCYLWYEKTNIYECKFGERWVPAGRDPNKEIARRIKDSVGVRKDLIKDGTVVLEKCWDVTDYAKKYDRFYPHGKVDDHIRPHIGFRKNSTGEVHQLPAAEVAVKVDRLLAKLGQPLPVVGLSAWQQRSLKTVLEFIDRGHRTVSAELCARFGKTIWSGALVRETNSPVTVIASYVLTSFTSFEKDLSGFEQFKDLVLIDLTADEDYRSVIQAAIDNDKQVVAFLSLCAGANRQKKLNYLSALPLARLWIVDEADFGAKEANQAKPLIAARQVDDVVVLMTGTNADRASKHWLIDAQLSVTYPELILEKRSLQPTTSVKLKHFALDTARHQLVVDLEFYQMDLGKAVALARQAEPNLFGDGTMFLPSWSKFAADPQRAKGFWTRMLEAVFLGQHGLDELNIDMQTRRAVSEGPRVAMMFMSGSFTNANLAVAAIQAQEALPGYLIVPVYGEEMTNRSAEGIVKEKIQQARRQSQNVLLLSAGMASRSFSVGDIAELYLAYDEGDNGATIQKISRALTPATQGKIGRIISLSFDPNRDDKFDALLLQTALNYKKTYDITSAKDALRTVLKTVDIFRCTEDGAVALEVDHYLTAAIGRNSLSRVVGMVADLSQLDAAELAALADGDISAFRAAKVQAAERGKTRLAKLQRQQDAHNERNPINDRLKLIANARKVIVGIVENMDIIVQGTNAKNLHEAFDMIQHDPEQCRAIHEEFGLEIEFIVELFDRGIINQDLIELQVDL